MIIAVLLSSVVSCGHEIEDKKQYPHIDRMEVLIDDIPVSESHVLEKDIPSCIEVKVYPSDLEVKRMVCSSSDTTLVKVTPDGIVTAIGYGSATLNVSVHAYGYGSYTSESTEIAVSVRTIELAGLSIGCEEQPVQDGLLIAESGQELHLFPVLEPSNSSIKDIRWETSSKNISIDENGILTARRDGCYKVSLTVSTLDEDYSVKDTIKTEIGVQIGKMIDFADPAMEKICVKYYDTNEDGFVSFQEAEEVSTWSESACKFNEEIKSFNEFKYFKNIHTLGARSFWGCTGLEEVTLPDNIREVHTMTFYQCISLKKVTLPQNLRELHYKAFAYCIELKDINIPDSLEILKDSVFEGDDNLVIPHLYLPDIKEIGTGTIPSVPSLHKITFGKKVRRIAEYSAYFCPNLEEVIFEGDNPPECGMISFWSEKKITVKVPESAKERYLKKYLFRDTWTTSDHIDMDNDIIRFENDEIEGSYNGDVLETPDGRKINFNQIIRIKIDGKRIPVILKDHVTRTVGYDSQIHIVGV